MTWYEVVVCFSVFGTAFLDVVYISRSVQVALKMVKDDKAASAVLGQWIIERNQLFVSIAKSKLPKQHEGKNEQATKPEELVRLYDLLLQVII